MQHRCGFRRQFQHFVVVVTCQRPAGGVFAGSAEAIIERSFDDIGIVSVDDTVVLDTIERRRCVIMNHVALMEFQ